MTNARTAKDIFLDATELPFSERDAYVEDACEGDVELARRVRSLLKAHTGAERLIPDIPSATTTLLPDELEPETLVGSYRLISVLGEGGFGTVWLAEQEQPVRRQAAVKVLKSGPGNREVTARFEAERQALAMMDHPCIARVYDGGTTESGRPYFAMELVDGVPLIEYARSNRLALVDRLELFLDVCRAVQHAHQKGVIHRDIKPSNVMVTVVDGRPTPKVIDFGIAKAVEGTLTDSSLQTLQGQLVGTPAYMSPEQVRGSQDIDTRTDVYSLGVLLYELICDSTPFDEDHTTVANLAQLQRKVLEEDPQKPSSRLLDAPTDGISQREVRGDLDWIVMCCLEKDRERRYDSADVLANEVARHLRGEPVLAGPPDLGYRVAKFTRRHRVALATAALIVVLLVTGVVTTLGQLRRALDAERSRATELARYESIAEFLQDVLLSISPEEALGRDRELLLAVLAKGERRVNRMEGAHPSVEATLRRVIGTAYFSLGDFDVAQPLLERALELRREHLGDDDPETLQSILDLGTLFLRSSRPDQAEPLLVEFMERAPRVLEPDDEDMRAGRLNYATLLRMLGQPEEAAQQYRVLLEQRTEEYGEAHADTIRIMNNLAGALEDMGEHDEVLELYERALELQLEVQGELHPETLAALNNYAGTLMEYERFDEALPMLERALSIKKKVLPKEHPSLVIAYNNLGDCLSRLERYEEASELYEEGLRQAIAGQGEGSTPVLILQHNLGNTLRKLDRLDEAVPLLEKAAAGFEGSFGDSHRYTLSCNDWLGRLYCMTGRVERGLECSTEVLELAGDMYPEDSEELALHRLHHGQNLTAAERYVEALGYLMRAHEAFVALEGTSTRDAAVEAIAELHEKCDRPEEAAAWRAKLTEE